MITSHQTLLFIGDSITDCGRTRPVGYARGGLGEGYVAQVDAMWMALRPDHPIRVVNTGIGGNRIMDLTARWQTDVLDLRPDWLSVKIGINDVWRQFDNPLDPAPSTLDVFEKHYRALLEKTRPGLKGLVLMTPYFLEPDRNNPMRAMMDQYGAKVQELAREYDALFVDTQAVFDAYMARQHTQTLCSDRVHPNRIGHFLLARAFLEVFGFRIQAPA
jgi:lysophospholipase L1-like esterase